MISRQTVFTLGAGANVPYGPSTGFPIRLLGFRMVPYPKGRWGSSMHCSNSHSLRPPPRPRQFLRKVGLTTDFVPWRTRSSCSPRLAA